MAFTPEQLATIKELRELFVDPPTEATIALRHNILIEEALAKNESELEKIEIELEQDLDALSELKEQEMLLQINAGGAEQFSTLEKEINFLLI